MKKITLFAFCLAALQQIQAQKILNHAVISTTSTIEAPEDNQIEDIQNQGNERARMFRSFTDGETKVTTYYKDSLVKTVLKTDMMRTTILRDNNTKMTTTLLEVMGRKNGFYISDEEQAAQRVKMDSMMRARRNDTGTRRPQQPARKTTEFAYTTETKKIAGYTCKKAYVVNTNILGQKDSSVVWYTTDIRMPGLTSTAASFGNFGGVTADFSALNGFVMWYQTKMQGNRTLTLAVNKIDEEKNIDDKEFAIPKDFELKPMSEMRSMFGGMGGGGRDGGGGMRMGN